MTVCRYREGPLAVKDRAIRSDGKTERLHAKLCCAAYYSERKAAARARQRGEPDAKTKDPRFPGRQRTQFGICTSPVCSRPAEIKGYCEPHYKRVQYGSKNIATPVRGDV